VLESANGGNATQESMRLRDALKSLDVAIVFEMYPQEATEAVLPLIQEAQQRAARPQKRTKPTKRTETNATPLQLQQGQNLVTIARQNHVKLPKGMVGALMRGYGIDSATKELEKHGIAVPQLTKGEANENPHHAPAPAQSQHITDQVQNAEPQPRKEPERPQEAQDRQEVTEGRKEAAERPQESEERGGRGNSAQPQEASGVPSQEAPEKVEDAATNAEAMRWIDAHPFHYDNEKTVEENAAIAQQLAKDFLAKFGETTQINTPARIALRRSIIEELYGDGAKKKERQAFIVMGLPASGKSSAVAEPLAKEHGALIIDSDEAKAKLPEFADGLLASAVHEESSDIAGLVMDRALAQGDNVVLPVVGKTLSSLEKKIADLKAKGYRVNLYYVDLPVEKAIERGKGRFQHTGRLVPLDYIRKVGLKPKENFDKIKTGKAREEVDHYEAWSNDVVRGQRPRLLETGPEGLHAEDELVGRGQRNVHASGTVEETLGAVESAGTRPKESRDRVKPNNESRSAEQGGFSRATKPAPGRVGKTVTVETDSGTKIEARYRLVPQSALITSNLYADGTIVENPAYPQDVQPRDRTGRKELRAQTDKIATQMQPEKLGASVNLNQGAPIIRSDGVVLNGNGRTMGITHAYELRNDSSTSYTQYLIEHAEEFGFTKQQVRDMATSTNRDDKPILVREVGELDKATLDEVINSTTGGASMGAAELAASDAARITSKDFADYDPESDGDITKASNDNFVAKLLRRLVPESGMNRYVDKNGSINQDGYQRVKRAMFSAAYQDADLIAKMAESMDDAIKNVSNGLQAAAANVARLNLRMKEGDAHEYPLAQTIAAAVKKYNAIKEGKAEANVEAYATENENAMFERDPDEVVALVQVLDEYRRSGKKLGQFFNNLARIIDQMGSPKEDATAFDFGEASKRMELPEVIHMAKEEVENDGGFSLFGPSENQESTLGNDADAAADRGGRSEGTDTDGTREVSESRGARVSSDAVPRTESVNEASKETAEEPAETQDTSIFGNIEDADRELFEELGINPDEEETFTAPAGITNTAEERARLEKELAAELNKISANPIFNPKIYELGVRLAMTYVKDGINTAKKLIATLNEKFGDSIGPWAPAIVETVRTWPQGVDFDAKKVRALSKAVGARYERGINTRDAMHDAMKKAFKGQYDAYAPMIDAAYNGIEKFFTTKEKEETANAHDSTSGLAERAGTRGHQDDVGRTDESGEPRTGSKREGVREVGTESRPFGSIRVRDGSAAPRGEIGDRGVQAGEPVDSSGRAGNSELPGGVKSSLDGSSELDRAGQENPAPSAQERHLDAATEKVTAANEKTKKPHTAQVKTADLAQIKDDCPSLQDAQAEDVVFGETRLFDKGGTGVMFTNGTGTGKTFTGMGLVKRMILRGKKNILIVSPTGEINKSWVETAKKYFGVDIHVLKDTNDAGKDGEVCVTTYANFQQNDALVHDRDWDAVIADESHNIMNNANGEDTGILKMLRAVTMHARGLKDRLELKYRTKQMENLQKQMADLTKQIKAAKKGKNLNVKQLEEAYRDAEAKYYTELGKIREAHKDVMEKWEALPKEQKPKVIFLSATPFAYDKDVDYAEGYLFDYPPDGDGYNSGSGRDKFMMQHFGYRMRYNKLTRPDGKVDNRAMEVQFHDTLVNEGVLHGRQLEVDADYDRGFLLVDQGIGAKIDEGFHILWDDKRFRELGEFLRKQFDRRTQRYLLESIKAKSAVKLAKQYEKMGRKVVIFHQAMVEHDNIHPFNLDTSKLSGDAETTQKIREQYEAFAAEHPDLVHLNIGDEPSPMETFRDGFGDDALYIDGSAEHKKGRKNAVKQFNDDTSGKNIIIVQQDAGNAGISLHDLTGKHPRVLLNIALPERPSYAMQIEGRIYRVGNASNAVFRYLATGTDLEKSLFASTIGGRAETVENLALGAKARGLRDSFTTLYQEVLNGDWKRRLPGHKEEGTGGKDMDRSIGGDLSDYERAKSFYFGRGKKTAKNKAAEGTDYFATPEPIGLKMVEWLGQKIGDRFLEPSAGHGAISRWSSPNAQNTIVEPSGKLAPEAQLVTPDAKVVRGRFEDLDLHNKYDGIAMNPPFGTGGKTAVEHIAKAYQHLADGGRLVAILPDGPTCMKRFHAWLYGENEKGESIKGAKPPQDAVLMAEIRMPSVMFERAGTKVFTRIVVIDKYANESDREAANAEARGETDYRDVKDIGELFDRIENKTMPSRIGADRKENFTVEKANKRTRTSSPYEANVEDETLRDKALYNTELQKIANKHHGGFFYSRKTFAFQTSEDARAFAKDADRYIDENKAYFYGEPEEAPQETVVPTTETAEREAETAPQETPSGQTEEAPTSEDADGVTRVKSGEPLIDTSDYTHTKTGEKMLAVKINTKLSDEGYKKVKGYAKAYGGYYNRYAKRFIFKTENGRNMFAMDAYSVAYDEAFDNGDLAETHYSVSRGEVAQAKAQTKADLDNAIQKALPGASKSEYHTETTADGSRQGVVTFNLVNGMPVEIRTVDKITPSASERARAKGEHGMAEDEAATINGYVDTETETTISVNGHTATKSSMARIVLSRVANFTDTLYHEVFHVAYDLFLTKKEKAAIEHAYGEKAEKAGMTIEEYAADRYRDWAKAKLKGLHTSYGKIWQKVSDGAEKTSELMVETEEVARIFDSIESGEMFERPLDMETRERDNEGGTRAKEAERVKTALLDGITKSVSDKFMEKISELNSEASVKNILHDHASKLKEKVLAGINRQVNRFRTNDIYEMRERIADIMANGEHDEDAKRQIKEIVAKASADDIRLAYSQYRNMMEEVQDYAGIAFEELAHGRKNSERFDGLLRAEDVERSNHSHGGTFNLQEIIRGKQLNNESRSENQDGFSDAQTPGKHTTRHYSAEPSTPSDEETAQRGRSFVKNAADKLGKALHLKSDKIMLEEDAKDPTKDINLKQATVLSPSRVAAKVPVFRALYTMACRAMDKNVGLRNDFGRKFDDALSGLSKSEREELFDTLLKGDAEGHEWTRDDLIADGASEAVADAYIKIRRQLNKAYHLVDKARRKPEPKSKTVTEDELKFLRENKFVSDLHVTDKGEDKNGKHRYLVSYMESRNYKNEHREISAADLANFRNDPGIEVVSVEEAKTKSGNAITGADGQPLYNVVTAEGPAPLSKLTGYIPHFFHEYMIRVVDKDGNARLIGSARNQREAVQKGEAWLKENDLADGESIHVAPKVFDINKALGVSDDDYAPVMGDRDFYRVQQNLAKQNDMTLAEAKDLLDGAVRLKGRHRFFGNAMHRTGAQGYETDLNWALRHYFNSAARYVAMETEFKPKAISYFERMFGAFDKEYSGLAKYCKDYINDINGNPSALEEALNKALNSTWLFKKVIIPTFGDRAALTLGNGIANKVSYLTLGLNLSSALLNFTQLTNAAAYIGDVGSLVKMVRQGARRRPSLESLRAKQRKATSEAEKKRIGKEIEARMHELRILHETGVFNDIGLDSGSGYDQMRGGAPSIGTGKFARALSTANRAMDFAGQKSMTFFREADAICRRGTVLAAYEKARKQGKTHAEAIAFAKEVNYKANFQYGVQDAPNVFRRGSIISQLLLQFKKYGFKELEVMSDFSPWSKTTSRKQKVMFWAMYAMLCGAMGVPALDWLDEIFGEKTGFYLKDEIQKLVISNVGNKRIAAAILYGAPALANMNISNRAGLSDVIPTSLGNLFAGPAASKLVRFAQDFGGGNWANALRDVSPGLYNLYAGYSGEARGKRGRLNDRYDTAWDRILRAVGYKSVEESVPVDMQRIISRDKAARTKEKQAAQDAYIESPTSENKARLKELGVNPKTVTKEAQKKQQTREQRMESTVPKKDAERYKTYVDWAKGW